MLESARGNVLTDVGGPGDLRSFMRRAGHHGFGPYTRNQALFECLLREVRDGHFVVLAAWESGGAHTPSPLVVRRRRIRLVERAIGGFVRHARGACRIVAVDDLRDLPWWLAGAPALSPEDTRRTLETVARGLPGPSGEAAARLLDECGPNRDHVRLLLVHEAASAPGASASRAPVAPPRPRPAAAPQHHRLLLEVCMPDGTPAGSSKYALSGPAGPWNGRLDARGRVLIDEFPAGVFTLKLPELEPKR